MSGVRAATKNVAHTPGPWLQSSTVLVCSASAGIIANCTPVSEIPSLSIPVREVEANARLIAAAPEMLEALVGLESASLRMAQLQNRSMSKYEKNAPSIAEWDASRQEIDRARIKAIRVIKQAGGEA